MRMKLFATLMMVLSVSTTCFGQGAGGGGAGAAGAGGGQGGVGTSAGAGGAAVGGGAPAGPVGGGAPAGAVGGGAPAAATSNVNSPAVRAPANQTPQNPPTVGGVINLGEQNASSGGRPEPGAGSDTAAPSGSRQSTNDSAEPAPERRRPSVGCTTSARETDGSTTCIGERAGRH